MKIHTGSKTIKTKNGEEYKPIRVIVQNRPDVLAIIMRIIKYFFQLNFLGYRWRDNPENTEIFIYDENMENPEDTNSWPLLLFSIGRKQSTDSSFGGGEANLSHKSRNDSVKYIENTTTISIEVYGENKLETFKLADGISELIQIYRGDILELIQNIEHISTPQVSTVQSLQGQGVDTKKGFTCSMSFTISYTTFYKKAPLAPLFTTLMFNGISEDDNTDDIFNLGTRVFIPEDQ